MLTGDLAGLAACSVLLRKSDGVAAASSGDFFTPLVPQLESAGGRTGDAIITSDSETLKTKYVESSRQLKEMVVMLVGC